MQSDEMLAEAAAGGDILALSELVKRYKDRIYGFCRASLGSEDAADACQESFILAYRNLTKLKNPAKFRPWLFAIARNQVRKNVRERQELQPVDGLEVPSDDSEDPLFEMYRVSSLGRLVRELVGALSDANRSVVELYYLGSLDMREIADVLSLPPAVVKSRLYEARKDMSRRLVRRLWGAMRNESASLELADRIINRCSSDCECGLILQRTEETQMAEKTKKSTDKAAQTSGKKSCGCGCSGNKK